MTTTPSERADGTAKAGVLRRRMWPALVTWGRGYHPVGLVFALVFFVSTLTPSLLPRTWLMQAVATGIGLATGYGVGVLVAWAVRTCGVSPRWSEQARRRGWIGLAIATALLVPTFLVLGSWWQNTVRELVNLPSDQRAYYAVGLIVAVSLAVALVGLGRGLRGLTRRLARFGGRFVPPPVARLGALVLVILLTVTVLNGALYRGILGAAESSFQLADEITAEGVVRPTDPLRSGSPESNEDWDLLGREGRTFVAGGPSAAQIEALTGRPALEPIRVYGGRVSADSLDGIAARVVAELDRTDAWDRSVLAVVTTTGSGWINNNVAGSLEYVTGGDSAIAGMQYSFLPSFLAFIADRETPQLAGQALFEAVYARWVELPEGQRPRLVVFGESLGSYGGMSAFGSAQDMVTRTGGGLYVGTPNFAEPWGRITAERDPGSLERLPVVDAGQHLRFASVPADTDLPGEWGDPRIVFWQHASDPITWWSFDLMLNRPDWLREPLGDDIDPGVRWFPFVTFWQVTLDMAVSVDPPDGHGHSYGPADAAELWAQILDAADWDAARSAAVGEAISGD